MKFRSYKMEKMKMNESTKYFVDLTVSKYVNSQDNIQKAFSNTIDRKVPTIQKEQNVHIKCNNMC